MSNNKKLFCDFDGVINRFLLPANAPANDKAFSDNKKTAITIHTNYSQRAKYIIRYSQTVVSFFRDFINGNEGSFVWLTSWAGHTHHLDKLLGVGPQEWINIYDYPAFDNSRMKHVALEEYLKDNDVSSYVWLDDEATQGYRNVTGAAVRVEPVNVFSNHPALVIQPDDRYGLVRDHLVMIREFWDSH